MMTILKYGLAFAIWMLPIVVCPSPSISQIVEQLQGAMRDDISFSEKSTLEDLVRYCRDWAREVDIDYGGMLMRTEIPDIHLTPFKFDRASLYDVLEAGCINSYHFFTIKNGCIYIYTNLPEYIETREWKNTKGKKLKAKWVGSANGNVDEPIFMTVPDGKIMKIDVEKMCAKDRKYLRESRSRYQKVSYVRIGGRWKSPIDIYLEEKEVREKKYIDLAKKMIMGKSYLKGAKYRVFQIVNVGTLCEMARVNSRGDVVDYMGELFLNWGLQRGSVADDEVYFTKKPLYWLGTYTYETRGGDYKTVNVYEACSLDFAINKVRSLQGLYDDGDRRFEHGASGEDQGTRPSQKGSEEPQVAGFGSGFFVTQDGYFITNHHVVEDSAKVALKIGEKLYDAKIVKIDKETDLALLKVDGAFDALELSPRRYETLGQSIFTMGYPQPRIQGVTPKVTKGVISGLEGFRGDIRLYQIDASIQPGNSGGPVADEDGYIVGVVVSSLVRGSSGEIPQNVNYAIKKSYLQAFIDAVPDCASKVQSPTTASKRSFTEAVGIVEKSCALVISYE